MTREEFGNMYRLAHTRTVRFLLSKGASLAVRERRFRKREAATDLRIKASCGAQAGLHS